MSEVNLVEAIRMALARAMEEDPSVLVLGEDVGRDGGVFRATDGLLARFGAARVFDTPVSEALLAGLAARRAAFPAGGRVPVRGVHVPRDRPAGVPCRAAAQPDPRPAVLPDRAARALRRRHQGARAPLREPRGVLRPHPGHPRRHPVLAARRLRPAARGDPRPGSRRLPRTQADLPGAEGAARGRRRGPAARSLLRPARGPRPDSGELGCPARRDPRGRRSAGRRGHRGGGDRRRDAEALRCRDGAGVGGPDRPVRDRPRGAAHRPWWCSCRRALRRPRGRRGCP